MAETWTCYPRCCCTCRWHGTDCPLSGGRRPSVGRSRFRHSWMVLGVPQVRDSALHQASRYRRCVLCMTLFPLISPNDRPACTPREATSCIVRAACRRAVRPASSWPAVIVPAAFTAIGGPGATCRLGLTLTDRGHVDGKRRVGVRGRAHGLADGLGRLRHATSTTREVDCACGGVSRNVGLL
jgi:hypothetical protein